VRFAGLELRNDAGPIVQTAPPFSWTAFRLPLSIPRTSEGFGCGLTVLLVAHKMARVVYLAQAFYRALKPWYVGLACGALLSSPSFSS
jgi:hypothetical protein